MRKMILLMTSEFFAVFIPSVLNLQLFDKVSLVETPLKIFICL